MLSVRVKQLRKASRMTQEEVAKRLGISKQIISNLENNKAITEDIRGDLFAALSYLYQTSYSYLTKGEETDVDLITTGDDVLTFITNNQFLSWNAKGVLFHIFWKEYSEPSFNTIRQFSGDNYENVTSALNELMHYSMIFKYRTLGDIEVYGFNYLKVCAGIRVQRIF